MHSLKIRKLTWGESYSMHENLHEKNVIRCYLNACCAMQVKCINNKVNKLNRQTLHVLTVIASPRDFPGSFHYVYIIHSVSGWLILNMAEGYNRNRGRMLEHNKNEFCSKNIMVASKTSYERLR